MRRSINEAEYRKIAKKNQNALNTDKLKKEKLIINSPLWLVVENKYPYLEYDNAKVVKHLLIVPRNDYVEQFSDLTDEELSELSDIELVIRLEYEKLCKDYVVMYFWKATGKSIKKLHLHFLVLDYGSREHNDSIGQTGSGERTGSSV